jgi:hypothetical protein
MDQERRTSDASIEVNEDIGCVSCFEMEVTPLFSPRRNNELKFSPEAIASKMSTSDDIPMVINLDTDDSSSSCLKMDDTPVLFSPRPRSRLLKYSQKTNIPKTYRRSSLDEGLLQKAGRPKSSRRSSLPDKPAVTNQDGSSSSFEMGDAPMMTSPRRMRFSNKATTPKESKIPSFESRAKPFVVNFDSLQVSLSCFELLDESVLAGRSSVSFSSTSSEEHLIPHLNDLSREEKQSIWYQEQELDDIMVAVGETLRLRRKGGLLDPEEHCLQGLGPRTKKGDKERRSRWLLSLTCVLDEQKRQAKDGTKDPVRIAQLYQSFSQASEKVAIVSAERTAREQYMRER